MVVLMFDCTRGSVMDYFYSKVCVYLTLYKLCSTTTQYFLFDQMHIRQFLRYSVGVKTAIHSPIMNNFCRAHKNYYDCVWHNPTFVPSYGEHFVYSTLSWDSYWLYSINSFVNLNFPKFYFCNWTSFACFHHHLFCGRVLRSVFGDCWF